MVDFVGDGVLLFGSAKPFLKPESGCLVVLFCTLLGCISPRLG